MEEIQKNDLCRACLCSSENKLSIFSMAEDLENETKRICDLYSDCTSINVIIFNSLSIIYRLNSIIKLLLLLIDFYRLKITMVCRSTFVKIVLKN